MDLEGEEGVWIDGPMTFPAFAFTDGRQPPRADRPVQSPPVLPWAADLEALSRPPSAGSIPVPAWSREPSPVLAEGPGSHHKCFDLQLGQRLRDNLELQLDGSDGRWTGAADVQNDSFSSGSPSTVDRQGPASLAHSSSARESLLSRSGGLELSQSLSNPSLTISSNSSGREAQRISIGSIGSLQMCPDTCSPRARLAPHPLDSSAPTPDHTPDLGRIPGEPGTWCKGCGDIEEHDENSHPNGENQRTMIASEMATVRSSSPSLWRSDPLAQTVKVMRSLWESRAQENLNQPAQPRLSGGKDSDRRPGLPGRRSRSESIGSRRAGSMARLQRNIARTQDLHNQLTSAVRGTGDAEVAVELSLLLSSESESEPREEAALEEEDDATQTVLKAYMREASALWRAHRATQRLLLEHLLRQQKRAQGASNGSDLHLSSGAAPEAIAAHAGDHVNAQSAAQRRQREHCGAKHWASPLLEEEPAREPDANDNGDFPRR